MSIEQSTVEGVVKSLEDEVLAFKTSQPFYDGQFTTKNIKSDLLYDVTFVTNHDISYYDIQLQVNTSDQPNVIVEPYFQFYLTDGTLLGLENVNYVARNIPIYPGGLKAHVEINIVTYDLSIGTTVGIKFFYLISATIAGTTLAGLRP